MEGILGPERVLRVVPLLTHKAYYTPGPQPPLLSPLESPVETRGSESTVKMEGCWSVLGKSGHTPGPSVEGSRSPDGPSVGTRTLMGETSVCPSRV